MRIHLFRGILIRSATVVPGLIVMLVLLVGRGRAARAESNAMVRVVHASPAAGDVDVFVDGTQLLSNFRFGMVTGYVPLAAGAHKIQVALAGKGAGAAVITQTVSLNGGVFYTVAAIGTQQSVFSLAAFVDDNSAISGKARVRVYHLSPDAGPVNVAAGENTIISGLTYQKASDYLSVAPGDYTFDVTATDANAEVSVSATLKENTTTSVFAVGLLNGSPKLEFAAAQVASTPGMPGTGSDPNAQASNSISLTPWLLGGLLLVIIGGGLVTRRVWMAREGGRT